MMKGTMTTHQESVIYAKSDNLVMRAVGGETILVPVRSNVGDLDSVFTLNAIAARIWTLLDGKRTVDEVIEELSREYDAAPDVIRADVAELLAALEEGKLVSRVRA
jgi:hypothetical protein